MHRLVKWVLAPALVLGALAVAAPREANAQQFGFSFGSSPYGYYGNPYGYGYGYPSYYRSYYRAPSYGFYYGGGYGGHCHHHHHCH